MQKKTKGEEMKKNTNSKGLKFFKGRFNFSQFLKYHAVFIVCSIIVPSLFVAGKQDWGSFQRPGTLDKMQNICSKMNPIEFIDGAGHWVQQEQPEKVVTSILNFIKSNS